MSLEAALAELTKEIKRNNELLEKNIEGRTALTQKIANATPAAATAEPKAKAKKTEKPAKDDGAVDLKMMLKTFGDYLDVEEELGAKEAKKRKAFVEALLEGFGVGKINQIAEEDRPRAIALLKKKIAGEDVNFSADDGDDDEDERPAPKAKKKASDDDDEDERPAKKSKKKPVDDDEDDEDEDEGDDEDEDDE